MRLVLAVFVMSCGSSSDEPPKPAARDLRPATHELCVAASRGGLASPGGTGLGPEVEAELRRHREPIILERCTEDAWPTDAARCFAAAEGLHAIGDCLMLLPMSAKLTADLQAQMHRDLNLK